jgi:hypothetical protein
MCDRNGAFAGVAWLALGMPVAEAGSARRGPDPKDRPSRCKPATMEAVMSTRHTILILALAAVACSGCFSSPDGERSQQQAAVTLSRDPDMHRIAVPAGTNIEARLEQELSPLTNEPGDRVSAVVAAPVAVGGKIVIPAGAKVLGRVTAVEQSTKDDNTTVLKLAFTEIAIADKSYPMDASMIRAHPEVRSKTNSGEAGAQIGASAVGGAILGRILGGDSKSTALGALAGAAAGTAIVLGTRDSYAVLPAGSVVQLRTTEPLHVLAAR